MKRQAKSGAARPRRASAPTKKPARPRSPKTVEIVSLVEAISADFGPGNGVHLGKGIARLLASAYRHRRRTIPPWVEQLLAHYTTTDRES